MITVIFQCVDAWLSLAFGALAMLIVARIGANPDGSAGGWRLAAWAFGLIGVSGVIQTTMAASAWRAGPGTPVYEGYLRWAMMGNDGRNAVSLALAAALAVYAARPPGSREAVRRWAPAALIGALAVGSALGSMVGPMEFAAYVSVVAVVDLIVMILLLAALLVAMARNTLDRVLWLSLALYALRQALAVIWVASTAWGVVPGAWVPSPAQGQMVAAGLGAVMVAAAIHRLRLARSGTFVPAILEPLDRARPRPRMARE